MSPVDQAANYIRNIPGAVSGAGGHNQTYSVAAVLIEGFGLSISEARPLLAEYSARCQPPWSEREIDHKLESVKVDPSKVGGMVRHGARAKFDAKAASKGVANHASRSPSSAPQSSSAQSMAAKAKTKPARYEVGDSLEMPDPIADGARKFILAAFSDGEGVRIAQARLGDDGRELPKDAGVTLSREEWLRKLDKADGDPNKILKTADRNGIFISVNPMKLGGSKDADVTAFRHALLEFDNISKIEQWGIIQQSRVPCTAVISSGGKSIHAWVRVDATNRQEFDERVKALYQHFADYKPDEKNKNPSRFSRLPFCERGANRQELLALGIGCESFAEWTAENSVDGIGEVMTVDDIDAYDPKSDDSLLIGTDWLCRSEAALLVGPSGVGKSSLAEQMVISWCVGLRPFSVQAVRPLRAVVLQAENTKRYLKKSLNGIRAGLGIDELSDHWNTLRKNLLFVRDTTHTGHQFVESLRRLVDRHRPDLIVIDPLLSFLGGDINKVEVVSEFCRTWINPILESANVAALFVHHTGKPPADAKAKKHWQITDFSYSGLGSSELTNWARAICTLQACGQGEFRLIFSKRTFEAGATHLSGEPASSIRLRHSSKGIYWEQMEEPDCHDGKEHAKGKPSKVEALLSLGLGKVIDTLTIPTSKNEVARRIMEFATKGENRLDVKLSTCKTVVERLFENKAINKQGESYVKA